MGRAQVLIGFVGADVDVVLALGFAQSILAFLVRQTLKSDDFSEP